MKIGYFLVGCFIPDARGPSWLISCDGILRKLLMGYYCSIIKKKKKICHCCWLCQTWNWKQFSFLNYINCSSSSFGRSVFCWLFALPTYQTELCLVLVCLFQPKPQDGLC
jgi:hypothetical protein